MSVATLCGGADKAVRSELVQYRFNANLMLDMLYAKDINDFNYAVLNIIWDTSGFSGCDLPDRSSRPSCTTCGCLQFRGILEPLGRIPRKPSSRLYLAHVANDLKQLGARLLDVMPLEAPGIMATLNVMKDFGRRSSRRWRMNCNGVQDGCQRISGYAPNQRVFGVPQLRISAGRRPSL